MENIIGKISATEKNPSTLQYFYFWTKAGYDINPFDIVKVEHINNSFTFGRIEEIRAQPTNPVGVCKSLTQKHVAKRYMIAEKLLPLHHESYQQYKYV